MPGGFHAGGRPETAGGTPICRSRSARGPRSDPVPNGCQRAQGGRPPRHRIQRIAARGRRFQAWRPGRRGVPAVSLAAGRRLRRGRRRGGRARIRPARPRRTRPPALIAVTKASATSRGVTLPGSPAGLDSMARAWRTASSSSSGENRLWLVGPVGSAHVRPPRCPRIRRRSSRGLGPSARSGAGPRALVGSAARPSVWNGGRTGRGSMAPSTSPGRGCPEGAVGPIALRGFSHRPRLRAA